MTRLLQPDPPLARDGIVLRPPRADDVDPAWRGTQDPLVPRFTSIPVNNPRERVAEYFDAAEDRRLTEEELILVIADAGSDGLLGVLSLLRIDFEARRTEIGYWLAPWARGRGAMTTAVTLLSRWAIAELGFERVELRINADNAGSRGVAQRAGFTLEGTLRSYDEWQGERRDFTIWGLLREDLG